MIRLARLAVVASTLVTGIAVRAETPPDPTVFLAQMTAFAELCAARFPEMSDTPAKLVDSMSPSDRKFYDNALKTPAFGPAIAKARVDVTTLPAAKVAQECKAMHDGLTGH